MEWKNKETIGKIGATKNSSVPRDYDSMHFYTPKSSGRALGEQKNGNNQYLPERVGKTKRQKRLGLAPIGNQKKPTNQNSKTVGRGFKSCCPCH